MKRSFLALTAGVLLASVTACGSAPDAEIQPAPATVTPDTTTSTSSSSDTSSSQYAEQLDPCSLLNASDKQTLNVARTSTNDTGTGESCVYNLNRDGDIMTVSVTVKAGQPLSQLSSRYAKETTDITIDGQKAKLIRSVAGCIVGISSGETSRVEIIGIGGGDQDAACQLAKKVAGMVQGNMST